MTHNGGNPKEMLPLPKLKENRKFIKRREKVEQKRREEEERELMALRVGKNRKTARKAMATTGAKKPKERRPKTVVANAPTGRETFAKHEAKNLVKKLKESKKKKGETGKPAVSVPEPRLSESPAMNDGGVEARGRALLTKIIQGDAALPQEVETPQPDGTTYEDEVLAKANEFFSNLHKRERALNTAAAKHLRRLREINRRGGDKDGFHYVLPRNTKELVREMLTKEGHPSADVDTSTLSSTFGSAGMAEEEDDKPVRRTRRRGGTYNDFYQFQVSKQWTRNAEKFLFRNRVDKSLFESKKRERSIKKL